MAITPNDIKTETFSAAARGYDATEVDAFLDAVAAEVDRLMKRIVDLNKRCTESSKRAQDAIAENASLRRQLMEQTSQAKSRLDGQLSETQLTEVFVIAKQSADRMVDDAKSQAENIVSDAEAKGREIIRQALAEKQREIDEINRLQRSRVRLAHDYQSVIRHHAAEAATQVAIAEENLRAVLGDDVEAIEFSEPEDAVVTEVAPMAMEDDDAPVAIAAE